MAEMMSNPQAAIFVASEYDVYVLRKCEDMKTISSDGKDYP